MNELKPKYSILVVEDNQSMREGIVASLRKEAYLVDSASDGKLGMEKFRQSYHNLMITDIKMPQMDGIDLFHRVRELSPATDVILITAYATVELAVSTLKQGAIDFITKPFSNAELRSKVEEIFQRWANIQQIGNEMPANDLIIGNSAVIRKIKSLIQKVAQVESPVLITGESGTGKELVARTIHNESPLKKGPFIAVNCAALSESLLESELFGHEKGAFTGAVKSHAGKFEQSHDGIIFLDEIGDMSPGLQVKLLRVLQTKKFQRVGGESFISSDFRLIAATNKDLQKEVNDGNFRSDLFYRLNVIPIHLPPLRDRKEDIPLIADFILHSKSAVLGRSVPSLDKTFLRKLQYYSWPGNVRELENFIERALVFVDDDVLTDSLFSFSDGNQANSTAAHPPPSDLVSHLEKIEREILVNALRENRGIKQRTADSLNIKTSTLYYKIEKYKIEESEYAL